MSRLATTYLGLLKAKICTDLHFALALPLRTVTVRQILSFVTKAVRP